MQKIDQLPISSLYTKPYITAVASRLVGLNAETKLKIDKVYKILEVNELELSIEFNAELTQACKDLLGAKYSSIITKNLNCFRLTYKNKERLCN